MGLAAVALLACSHHEAPPTAPVVGVSVLRISLPVFVAAERGLFRKHGLDVTLRRYETAQPMLEEIVDERIDAGGFVAYPIVALASQNAPRPPLVATALIEDADHRLSYALARRGSALRFPRDARARSIGILPTVAYRKWLEAILHAAGVPAAEVRIVPIAPPLQAQALTSGGVDFLFTNDPAATAMIDAGVAEVVDDGPPCPRWLGSPFAFGTFAISRRLADRQPEVAARLVDAIDEAIAEVNRDPAAAAAAMLPYLRPEQRAAAAHYPASRYLPVAEAGPSVLDSELERELTLGILTRRPGVATWSPRSVR